MRLVFLALCALLVGCDTLHQVQIVKVDMPIPIPCNIIAPKKPVMPFTDSVMVDIPSGKPDLFGDSKRMLAEIENRKGYEFELEAAIQACNSK